MNEPDPGAHHEPDNHPGNNGNPDTAKIIYILYLVGLIAGVTGIIGVVMAYINRNDAPPWLRSHYDFLIRTFWIGFVYLALGTILSFILVGFLIFLFWVIWLIVRCVQGMKYLDERQPHPAPESWFFN